MLLDLESPVTAEAAPDLPTLRGKVALITGAGTGIGRAAALALARRGASVVLAGRRQGELDAAATQIIAAGGVAAVVASDLARDDAAENLIAATLARFGRLDIAFNNAGTTVYSPIEAIDVVEFDRVMATNVRGVWLLLKHEIAAMRAAGRGGVIVNTSSIAATGAMAGLSAYAASKAALDAMTRVLALEAGADGIRINNVSPGVTRTPMTDGLPESALSAIAAHSALKRVADPEDIADAVAWLCGNEARFITGQAIQVDGGFNLAGMR